MLLSQSLNNFFTGIGVNRVSLFPFEISWELDEEWVYMSNSGISTHLRLFILDWGKLMTDVFWFSFYWDIMDPIFGVFIATTMQILIFFEFL